MIQPIFQPRKTTAAEAADPSQPRIGCFSCRALSHSFRSKFRSFATSLSRRSRVARRWITLTLTFTLCVSWAAEAGLPTYAESIQRLDPMGTSGLDPGLASVLRKYYEKNFTSEWSWEQIQSIRFDGMLELPQGVLRFNAFKKKPDYCKVVLHAPGGGRIVMAHDGQDAWQLNTVNTRNNAAPQEESGIIHHSSASPSAMPEGEALNFIRDAATGGHLLYPLLEGKQLQLLGTTTVDGERCYELKITLPDGQMVRSMLNTEDYSERRQVVINNVNGDEEVTTHSDFRQIDGIRVPFSSTLTIDGEQVHQVRLYSVETNVGVMPWMFSRPSRAYPLGEAPGLPADVKIGDIDLDVAVEEALNLQIGDSAFQVEPEFLGNEAADPTALPSESLYKLSNP